MKLAQRTLHALPMQAFVMASCFAASGWAFAQQTPTSTIADPHAGIDMPAEREQLPLDDLRKFTAVFSRIKDAYVEEVTDSQSSIRIPPTWLQKITKIWKKAPAVPSVAWASKWAWKTALLRLLPL